MDSLSLNLDSGMRLVRVGGPGSWNMVRVEGRTRLLLGVTNGALLVFLGDVDMENDPLVLLSTNS